MITIYEATETNFDTLGLGTLIPSSCTVTEELNGQYSLTFSHPIDEDEKWKKIQQDRIVKVPTHDGEQLFRLYKPVKNSQSKTVSVNALHIFYDLRDNLIEDTRPTIKDGQDAGDIILGGCQYTTPFTFLSDIEDISTAYYIRKNPVEAFIGSEDQSFINRWGGEIRRDKFSIEINQRRGLDTGMKISYRKNLTGVTFTSDVSQIVTRIMPTALNENGVVFYTDEKYYDSPLIGTYPHPKIGVLSTGIRVGQEVDGSVPYPDIATAKSAMAEKTQAYFDAGADKPDVSISVTYIDLGETDEYAPYKDIITKAQMGDEATLEHPDLDIDVKLRVVKIQWDAANNRISSIVLGSQLPNYANTAVSRDINISALNSAAPTNLKENGTYNNVYINHEDGFVAEATIDGQEVTAKFNASEIGFYDSSGTRIGGLGVVGGKLSLIAGTISNDDDTCYGVIGDLEVEGFYPKGLGLYSSPISASEPAAMILAHPLYAGSGYLAFGMGAYIVAWATTSGGSDYGALAIKYGDSNIVINRNGEIEIEYLDDAQITLNNNGVSIDVDDNGLGVDSTGAYKVSGGTKTYL